MKSEELERIKQYSDKIQATDGSIGVLTEDEREDFRELLAKWLDEQELTLEKKEVTREKYVQALDQHSDEVYHIAIQAWQMPLLHGLIALAADHPGVKKLGWPTRQFIRQIRWWCRERFSEWGFTPEEVEYLDKMREDAQGNITEE